MTKTKKADRSRGKLVIPRMAGHEGRESIIDKVAKFFAVELLPICLCEEIWSLCDAFTQLVIVDVKGVVELRVEDGEDLGHCATLDQVFTVGEPRKDRQELSKFLERIHF